MAHKQKDKHDYYYDAMEYLNAGYTKTAKKLLKKSLKLDEDYVEAYVGMTAAFKEEGDAEKVREYTDLAFEKTRKVFPQWPEKMIWGVLQNRQYLRAICDKASLYHKDGDVHEAEKLYRLILKFNPKDNQGIRYLLAALFAGESPDLVDELFEEGNRLQNWDKVEKLLVEQNAQRHFWDEPAEF